MMHYIGDTVLRIDKIIAIRHNTKNDFGPTNQILICLDDAQSSIITSNYSNYEEPADDFEKLADKLEGLHKNNYYIFPLDDLSVLC